MASSLPQCEPLVVEEEDYIDMDISSRSSASLFCYSTIHSPPPHCSRDFEFQMSSKPLPEIDGIISPADELFYKGKLLPLHLPPRLQLLQKLLQDSITTYHANTDAPFDANTAAATTTTTPYESYNISPATSCYVSGELNPEDYFVEECQKDTKKSWTSKFKLIKQSSSSLRHKLKAPKAYLKSLFTRSRRSDESPAAPRAKECSGGYAKAGSKAPPGHPQKADAANLLRRIDGGERMVEEIKRRSSNNSCSASSSCSSSNSSSFSSVNSEVERSILGAIAYCKKSQQEEACVRKGVSDVEFYSLPASRIVADCEKQGRPETCRG